MTKEQRFYKTLQDVFIGAKIEILIWLKYEDIRKYLEIMKREYPDDPKELNKEMKKYILN